MNRFWKTTGKFFGKLVITKVFGLVLSLTIFMALHGQVGSIITQACSLLILIVIFFSSAWDLGAKDANLCSVHSEKPDPLFGFKTSLAASVPDLCMGACLLLTKLRIIAPSFGVLYGIFNSVYMPFHQAVLPQTLTVAEHNWIGYIASALTVLIAPICAGFGYRLGLTQISLGDTLLYTTPEARKRHEEKLRERKGKKRSRLFR